MKIVAEVIRYDLHDDDTPLITISGLDDKEKTIFSFDPEYAGTEEDWRLLLEACQTEKMYYLQHDQSNGDCSIDVGKNEVTFLIARYGSGCGGTLSINIQKELCIEAFQYIYNSLKDGYVEL